MSLLLVAKLILDCTSNQCCTAVGLVGYLLGSKTHRLQHPSREIIFLGAINPQIFPCIFDGSSCLLPEFQALHNFQLVLQYAWQLAYFRLVSSNSG